MLVVFDKKTVVANILTLFRKFRKIIFVLPVFVVLHSDDVGHRPGHGRVTYPIQLQTPLVNKFQCITNTVITNMFITNKTGKQILVYNEHGYSEHVYNELYW